LFTNALEEPLRQAKLCAQVALAAAHLASIGFVVVTGQVQQAMENQDLKLDGQGVAQLRGLAAGSGNANGEVAGDPLRGFCVLEGCGGEREHVGRLVFAAKTAIEPADLPVGGEQHCHLAAKPDCGLGFGEKAGEGARGGQAKILDRSGRGRLRRFGGCRRGVGVQFWVDEDHRARGRDLRARSSG
jgi:hypothetical protein